MRKAGKEEEQIHKNKKKGNRGRGCERQGKGRRKQTQ
jgi:hypothetical protein